MCLSGHYCTRKPVILRLFEVVEALPLHFPMSLLKNGWFLQKWSGGDGEGKIANILPVFDTILWLSFLLAPNILK
jgi:hypothetical protein